MPVHAGAGLDGQGQNEFVRVLAGVQPAEEGVALARNGSDFLAINGIQVQSAACLDLLARAPELASLGVEVLRVSPPTRSRNGRDGFPRSRTRNTSKPAAHRQPSVCDTER